MATANNPADVIDDAKRIANRGGCFIVRKADKKGPVFLVFRRLIPKNTCLGYRRDPKSLLDFVKQLVTTTPQHPGQPAAVKEHA